MDVGCLQLCCHQYYDKKAHPKHFREGERIYVINESKKDGKYQTQYIGPFEINKIDRETHVAEIQYGKHKKIIYLDQCKRPCEAQKGIEIVPLEKAYIKFTNN